MLFGVMKLTSSEIITDIMLVCAAIYFFIKLKNYTEYIKKNNY